MLIVSSSSPTTNQLAKQTKHKRQKKTATAPQVTKNFRYPKWRYWTLSRFIRLFWGWLFPYISHIHTAYTGEDEPSILGTNEMFGDQVTVELCLWLFSQDTVLFPFLSVLTRSWWVAFFQDGKGDLTIILAIVICKIFKCIKHWLLIHHRKSTWNLKMMISKRHLLFHGAPIFRFHVSFRGCICWWKKTWITCDVNQNNTYSWIFTTSTATGSPLPDIWTIKRTWSLFLSTTWEVLLRGPFHLKSISKQTWLSWVKNMKQKTCQQILPPPTQPKLTTGSWKSLLQFEKDKSLFQTSKPLIFGFKIRYPSEV